MCDHIKPKAQGGGDERANLQRLCRMCEQGKTGREGKFTYEERGACK